ncbi:MAG: Stealth CR1 domain-containing protein [Muribaculaceae bacterium]|nr:Stealth CR1 domain-containing protein [Muribaculaceae bacterium]
MKEAVDENKAIDAVILWVDGGDPALAAKRRQYSAGTQAESHDDIAGATRYADNGEIKWCVRSIERFAPWIRKIYIVTDGQDPLSLLSGFP